MITSENAAALQLRPLADRAHRLRARPADPARPSSPDGSSWPTPPAATPRRPRVAARVRPRPNRRPPAGDGDAFVAELDRIVAANFTNDYWEISLPNRLDTSSPRSPVLFAYLAALNLLDAEVLFSDVRVRDLLDPDVTRPALDRTPPPLPEDVPRRARASPGTRQINAIANMAFLDWAENAKISARAPRDLLAVMSAHGPTGSAASARCICTRFRSAGSSSTTRPSSKAPDTDRRGGPGGLRDALGRRPPSADDATRRGPASQPASPRRSSSSRRRAWNLHTDEADPKLEHVIVKTVCGFLNAEGGTLLIGVDDDGNVLGLDRRPHDPRQQGEPSTATSSSSGSCSTTSLSVQHGGNRADPLRADRRTARLSSCRSLHRASQSSPSRQGQPASDASEFWVRIGNPTKQLHGDDMVQYQDEHWG